MFVLLKEYCAHNILHSTFLSTIQRAVTFKWSRNHVDRINAMLNWHTFPVTIIPQSSLFPLGNNSLLHSLFATLSGQCDMQDFGEVKPISPNGYVGSLLTLLYNKKLITEREYKAFFEIQFIPASKDLLSKNVRRVSNPFPKPESVEHYKTRTDFNDLSREDLKKRFSTVSVETSVLDLSNKYLNGYFLNCAFKILFDKREEYALTNADLSRNLIGAVVNPDEMSSLSRLFSFFEHYCPHLIKIDMSYNRLTAFTETNLQNLKGVKSLKTLSLSNNNLTDTAVIALLKAFEEHECITEIDLSNNQITDAIQDALNTFRNKKPACNIHLTGNKIKQSINREEFGNSSELIQHSMNSGK